MTSDHSENRVTIWLSDELKDRIRRRLTVDDSYSSFFREAGQMRMAAEDELDRRGLELPADDDARAAALRDIALHGVDAYAADQE